MIDPGGIGFGDNHCLKCNQALLFFLFLPEMSMSKPTVIQVVKSVLAAAIGVQSDANRIKDFEQGALSTYVIAGFIFTALFVCALIFVVSIVLGV